MVIRVNATEAKARILALLDEVEDGQEIEITRRGRTIARLVPATGPHALRGSLTGAASSVAPDEELFQTEATWETR